VVAVLSLCHWISGSVDQWSAGLKLRVRFVPAALLAVPGTALALECVYRAREEERRRNHPPAAARAMQSGCSCACALCLLRCWLAIPNAKDCTAWLSGVFLKLEIGQVM
jgi:hypothetical protein